MTEFDELSARYASLWDRKEETERQAIEAANALWKFMDDRADRASEKPYEICGVEDGWHPRLRESDPQYDEDDLVAELRCQLPKGHKEFGYRYHLETGPDGGILGSWS